MHHLRQLVWEIILLIIRMGRYLIKTKVRQIKDSKVI